MTTYLLALTVLMFVLALNDDITVQPELLVVSTTVEHSFAICLLLDCVISSPSLLLQKGLSCLMLKCVYFNFVCMASVCIARLWLDSSGVFLVNACLWENCTYEDCTPAQHENHAVCGDCCFTPGCYWLV